MRSISDNGIFTSSLNLSRKVADKTILLAAAEKAEAGIWLLKFEI